MFLKEKKKILYSVFSSEAQSFIVFYGISTFVVI